MQDKNKSKAQLIEELRQLRAGAAALADNQTENTLSGSQRQLSTLIENLPGMVYRCLNDRDWTMEFISAGCLGLTGYPAADFIECRTVTYGKDIIHPDDREDVWNGVQKALKDKRPYTLSYRILIADNEEKWVWEQGCGIFDTDGEFQFLEGFITDITERKVAEEKLQLTQFVSDHAPDCIIWIDKQARICYVNAAMCRECGYTKEELLTMSIPDIDPNFPADAWPGHWKELQQKGAINFETRHQCKDGSTFPIEVSANFVRYGDKEFNIAFTRDITERNQQEEVLAKYKLLFDNISDLAYICDDKGNILYANKKSETLTGRKLETIIGQPFTPLFDEQNLAKAMDFYQRTLQGESPQVQIAFKDTGIMCEYNNSPLRDSAGNIIGVMGVARDITERRKAEAQMFQLAHFDSLTGLPNRALFMDRLAQALARAHRNKSGFSLLFLDLDRFKTVNDTLGHKAGDHALKIVADHLRACVREVDTVARLGGDEFTLILSGVTHREQASIVAEKISTVLGEAIITDGKESQYNISASIGIAICPDDGDDVDALINHADSAMYEAKKMGSGHYFFFQDMQPADD